MIEKNQRKAQEAHRRAVEEEHRVEEESREKSNASANAKTRSLPRAYSWPWLISFSHTKTWAVLRSGDISIDPPLL